MARKTGQQAGCIDQFAGHPQLDIANRCALLRPGPSLIRKIHCHRAPIAGNVIQQKPWHMKLSRPVEEIGRPLATGPAPWAETNSVKTHLAVCRKIHCTALGCSYRMAVMDNRGFWITLQSIRRQLSAMPHELYLIRLIHHQTHRAFPGERLWTADQLANTATIRFLRARNLRKVAMCIFSPTVESKTQATFSSIWMLRGPSVIADMCANGHDPCVVLQGASPRHLQAWIRLQSRSRSGDRRWRPLPASGWRALMEVMPPAHDWRHVGRLAGFTNQKPARRTLDRYAPWVKLVHARAGLAPSAASLLQSVRQQSVQPPAAPFPMHWTAADRGPTSPAEATSQIYRGCMERWHILERFPQPDWSIVDLWVARHLSLAGPLRCSRVQAILRLASPHFSPPPRRSR